MLKQFLVALKNQYNGKRGLRSIQRLPDRHSASHCALRNSCAGAVEVRTKPRWKEKQNREVDLFTLSQERRCACDNFAGASFCEWLVVHLEFMSPS